MALVLASASPRRRALLQNAGIPFIIQASKIPELPLEGEAPQACAERLAREKALDVFRLRPQDFVLGADTIVIVNGQILGKPHDVADAARMLRLLVGRTHQVTTGICLMRPDDKGRSSVDDTRSETTRVTMSGLNEDDIRSYIATGEPLDAFTQPLAQIGQLAGAKNQQRNGENDKNLRQPQFTNHVVNLHTGSPGALIGAFSASAIP